MFDSTQFTERVAIALEATVPEWRTVARSLSGCTEDQAVLQIESAPASYVDWVRTEAAKE